jgi:hypothetical protein
MSDSIPVPHSKSNKGIWITVIVIVACLCLAVVAVGVIGGGYYYLNKNGQLPDIPFFPIRPTVTTGSNLGSGPVVIESFDPSSSNLPTLQDLVTAWSGAITPSTSDWNITVTPYKQTLVFMGWCAATQGKLDENYQHIEWHLTIDSFPVDVNDLFELQETLPDQVCRTYVGLIRQWPGSFHTITTNQHLDATINDGWSDYPAGDYMDVYHVTVNP